MRRTRARNARTTMLMIAVFAMAVLFAARRIIAPGTRYQRTNARAQRNGAAQNDSGEKLTTQDDRDLNRLIREHSR